MTKTTLQRIPSPEITLDSQTAAPPTTPFERLGGRETIAAITNRFYDLMDSDPAYAELRAMHAADLGPMRESLAGFLTGWAGGPRDWFAGGKCVMSAHKSLAIGADTARQWMIAMRRAIDEVVGGNDPQIAKAMSEALEQMAIGMVR